MELVIDTSVIIAVLISEPERAALVEETRGAELVAPESVHWEVGNALGAMLKRKRISLDQALRAVDVYRQIPLRMVEVDLEAALQIADTHGVYAYDAYVIAAALRQRCAMLALDKGLLRAARAAGCRVIEVSR
jgi:predicted nucleic acid-binding protein